MRGGLFWTSIATFFGVGLIPFAPGTWGALCGALVALFLRDAALSTKLVVLTALVFFGTISSSEVSSRLKEKDPSCVVIDEVAGMFLASIILKEVSLFVLAFFLFRVFDILKPWPVKSAERLPGGLGIMADDLVAGTEALLLTLVLKSVLEG